MPGLMAKEGSFEILTSAYINLRFVVFCGVACISKWIYTSQARCNVEIVGQQRLAQFARKHAAARKPIRRWLDIVEVADWRTPADVRRQFNTADFLEGNRVIFNLGGNRYRLLVVAVYAAGILNVRWIGTHAEYSRKRC